MTLIIAAYELSPALQTRSDVVAALTIADPKISALRDETVVALKTKQDPIQTLDAVHRMQRIYLASQLGVLDDPKITEALSDAKNFPTWKNYASLNVPQTQKDILAQQHYDGHAPLTPLSLFVGDYTRGIAEGILAICAAKGDKTDIWIDDGLYARRLMNLVDETGAVKYGTMMARRYEGFARRIVSYGDVPCAPYIDKPAPENLELLRRTTFMKELEAVGWVNQKFTGSIMPTHHDAARDGLDFDEYVKIFMNMCTIDMKKIDDAHKFLISLLNPAETVHITNNDGTDVTFGIKGMTFDNSLIDYNIPGTEVFSSPVRDQVNGIIIAKGNFSVPFNEDKILRDITLEFKDGRIIRAEAEEGQQYLLEMVDKDEGSRYLGELAFGTNPALTRHVTNPLLVEKIGGSFHVAIGKAYDNKPDAIICNGNKSMVHWDITTMLRGKDGMVQIDDQVIMRGGVYLLPELAYLNGETS